jgi:hypothetical protein
MELLDEQDSLLSASASHIISFLFSQHSDLVSRHLLSPIQSVFLPKPDFSKTNSGDLLSDDETIRHFLKQLQLITSNPSPTLITALLRPILFTLFLLSVYTHGTHHTISSSQASQILESYVKSSTSPAADILNLTKKILSRSESQGWSFVAGETGGVDIRSTSKETDDLGLDNIQTRVEVLMEILQQASEDVKSEVFVGVIRQWLHPESKDNPMRYDFS